jgi:hypothetical protein
MGSDPRDWDETSMSVEAHGTAIDISVRAIFYMEKRETRNLLSAEGA